MTENQPNQFPTPSPNPGSGNPIAAEPGLQAQPSVAPNQQFFAPNPGIHPGNTQNFPYLESGFNPQHQTQYHPQHHSQHPLPPQQHPNQGGSVPAQVSTINISGVSKFYGNQPGLVNANLNLPNGGIVGLLGPNGCGKTTLLKILAGVITDYEGEVRLFQTAPSPESKRFTSYLPDSSLLADSITPLDAIEQYGDFFSDFDGAKAKELMHFLQLPLERKLSAMSKGMREKAQIALIMSRNAKVYLLDEPISGVDPAARQVILETIIKGFNPESLMIISTHLISDIEPIINTAVFMSAGQVFLTGDADELRQKYQTSLDGLFRGMYR